MIPILYYADDMIFSSNGIGRLSDIISCVVSEERNGIYECEFKYPITGVHYADIQEGRIISCTHDDGGDRQPFVIYRRSAPISGIVTFNAHHVSYELDNIVVKPFSAASITQTFDGIKNNSINDNRFTFQTNRVTAGVFDIKEPRTVRQVLQGQEGSVLDVYGASEYKYDKFTVYNYVSRGSDNGVTIRYSKNLTDITNTIEDGTYNAIVPFWRDTEGNVIYGDLVVGAGVPVTAPWTDENNIPIQDQNGNDIEFRYLRIKAVPYDFSMEIQDPPTVAELNAAAQAFLDSNQPWIPSVNLGVNFAALWQTEEYADYADLQKVKLCDTVHIIYDKLGVNAKSKVIRVNYNVLTESYDSIELGKPRTDFATVILQMAKDTTLELQNGNNKRTFHAMENAINDATAQLTGQNGDSHIVFTRNADGGLEEMYIMDTDNPETAVNVWRYNSAGWGHSSNGKNGPYTLAATQQGAILADFITAGVLQGYSDDNYWDLTNGRLVAEYGKIAVFSIGSTGLSFIDNYLSNNYYSASIGLQNMYYGEETWSGTPGGSGSYVRKYTHAIVFGQGFGIQTYNELIDSSAILALGIESFQNDDSDGFKIYGSTNDSVVEFWAAEGTAYAYVDWDFRGNLNVWGTKNRKLYTKDYSDRVLYSYETASPMFGDVGEGEIGEDGKCFVWIETIFSETINTDCAYQVFLQKYGGGDCYVSERTKTHFVVCGTPGLKFGWEMKAHQIGYESARLANSMENHKVNQKDYGALAGDHLNEILRERGLR